MSGPDYDDPDVEKRWCETTREHVSRYLERECVSHGRIGEWPAWHVAPYVSIWAVESQGTPNSVGCWVISGDLPTDYIPADLIKHPRDAMRAIARRWRRYCAAVQEGSPPDEFEIHVVVESPADLVRLLEARANLLERWAADGSLWDGV